MAGQAPAPLPSLGLIFDLGAPNSVAAPSYLPSIGLLFSGKGVAVSAGAFTLSGMAAALKSGRKAVAAAGSFSLTGVAATPTYSQTTGGGDPAYLPSIGLLLAHDPNNKFVIGSPGSFAVTGVAANLAKSRGLSCATGVFLVNGAPALRDMQVTSDKTTFAITGVPATLRRATVPLAAGVGSFVVTTKPAGLVYQTGTARVLAAQPGAFLLTGNDIQMPTTIARKLVADKGTFAVTGYAANIIAVHWGPVAPSGGTWTNVNSSVTTWSNG